MPLIGLLPMRLMHMLRHTTLSIAIASTVLFAATAYAADNAQTSPPLPTQKSATKTTEHSQPVSLTAVQVVGLRASQMKSIQLKRAAADIQDSITSTDIGQFPDVTIANSLQRIPGVQIDRVAGQGTTVQINGLPQVSVLLNGAEFLSASNIDSDQPNFQDIPSSLFSGVDVYKSSQAKRPNGGISGSINLRTWQPFDLKKGWTLTGTAEGEQGSSTKKVRPDVNALIGYNNSGRWGGLLSFSFSNLVHGFNNASILHSGTIAGENSTSAQGPNGYATEWGLGTMPNTIRVFPNGSVDVNGDGKSNGAFFSPTRMWVNQEVQQPKRKSLNAAFEASLGDSLLFTVNGFFNEQSLYDDMVGSITLPPSQNQPITLPVTATPTSTILHNPLNASGTQTGNWNQTYYTTQVYDQWFGDIMANTIDELTKTITRNYNAKLDFDNGGPFNGTLRFVTATASSQFQDFNYELTPSNGVQFPNTLMPGASPLAPGVYVAPSSQGGNYAFNASGFGPFEFPTTIDWSNGMPTEANPSAVQAALSDPTSYRLKGAYSDDLIFQHAGLNVARFDGSYSFAPSLSLDFGLKNSIRTARSLDLVPVAHDYAGNGASDPSGCLVRYPSANNVLNGGGVAGACTAGNSEGYFRGNIYPGAITGAGSRLPAFFQNNLMTVYDSAGVKGATAVVLNPNVAMLKNHPYEVDQLLYENSLLMNAPASWDVLLHTKSVYGQLNFRGDVNEWPVTGNLGFRWVRTNLNVTQNATGARQAYSAPAVDAGQVHTERNYSDILPSVNIAVAFTPKSILRFAGSKQMMPLTLDQWGGGITTGYAFTILPNGQSGQGIQSQRSTGNPNLNPWRSTNFALSYEYYMSPQSMFSVSVFRMKIASFVETGTSVNCDLPDLDGVVRGRCVPVTAPEQGTAATLRGAEANYQQAFTFLPGLLSHTGFDVSGTYAPSSTNRSDMAGHSVPFPDNSKLSGNLVIWYEHSGLQLRAAWNYRSKRAVAANVLGIQGFEEYQAAIHYIDASASYQIDPHWQVFLQATNVNNAQSSFYVVWPSQRAVVQDSERSVFLGVRGQL